MFKYQSFQKPENLSSMGFSQLFEDGFMFFDEKVGTWARRVYLRYSKMAARSSTNWSHEVYRFISSVWKWLCVKARRTKIWRQKKKVVNTVYMGFMFKSNWCFLHAINTYSISQLLRERILEMKKDLFLLFHHLWQNQIQSKYSIFKLSEFSMQNQ